MEQVARHIYSAHNVKITHTSIKNWVVKYTNMIKEYVESFYPDLGDVWSIDEMVLNVKNTKKMAKGFHVWLWSIIDPKTRFLVATEISKKREIRDARNVLASAKNRTSAHPNYVVSDSLQTYLSAIRKELDNKKTAHVRTKAIRDGFTNLPIERYHNEIRERLKSRRGLGNDKSSKIFSDLLSINHNFVKPHMGLDGKTPAEAANIDLGLGPDKYLDLIKQSGSKTNFVTALGKRISHVTVINEGGSIQIIPKGWIDKAVWIEINDILKLYRFSWLSHDQDSCWLSHIT